MSKQTIDCLSIYAGLDIDYVTEKRGVSINQVISRFFNKAESVLTPIETTLPTRENKVRNQR